MKTLSKILLFVFVIFPPENFSQGSIIVNGWKLFLKPEIDFQKTTSFLGNDGKIFYQTFLAYGKTTITNQEHLLGVSWSKEFWSSYTPAPDSFEVKLRVRSVTNLKKLHLLIPTQDSSSWSTGYPTEIDLANTDWQKIKVRSDKEWVKHIGRLYIKFYLTNNDTFSSDIGVEVDIDYIKSVDYRLPETIYDTFGDITDVPEQEQIPKGFVLSQNYPNPFNPATKIEFSLPKESNVSLKVYNILGEEVASLINEEKPTGNYEVNFNASNLPSGTYFYRLQADNYIETKKMILIK